MSIACACALTLRGGTLSADDGKTAGWPHWRGPTFDAISPETALASDWPAEGPPVLWSRDIGVGYSGFVASGNRVFTLMQTTFSQCVICMHADTGEEIWRHRYDLPYDGSGMYPGPRATPTLSDGKVYFAGPRGQIGSLDASDGTPNWTVNVLKQFDGKGMDFGYSASPLVLDGKVIVPVGGKDASVVALDVQTGKLVWKSGDQPGSYVGAIPLNVDGELHAVVFLQNALAAFDVATGRLVWQHIFSQGYDEHAAAPLYREPYLMIAAPFKSGAQIYRLSRSESERDAFDSTWVLDIPKLSNDTASSLLIGNHVFGFDLKEIQAKRRRPSRGSLRCIEWPTGKIKWSETSTGHVSMVATDEKLIMFNDRGELIIAEANPEKYVELGRTQVFEGEICWTAPALHRGRLFLRTPTRAACVYVGQPEQLHANQRDVAVPATLVPQPNVVGWYWLVGGERTYPFDTHTATELWNWFAAGICCFAISLVSAVTFQCLASRVADVKSNQPTAIAFWTLLIATGIAATPLLNSIRREFYFTWPVVLFASFQLTLQASVWADEQENRKRSRWISRFVGIAFLVTCVGYFVLCRKLSHSSEWIFLAGFLPAAAVAIPTAHFLQVWKPIRNAAWLCMAFSVYFWSSASINIWLLWNSVRSHQ